MPPKALIIFTPDQQALAERMARSLDAQALALDEKPPSDAAPLLMPLLSEAMLEAWEGSSLGEWAFFQHRLVYLRLYWLTRQRVERSVG